MSATPSVSDIAAALATALETIPGLRTASYLPDTFSPPVALIAIDSVEYHGAFAGGDVTHTFEVHLIVSRGSDRVAMLALEGYMSQAGSLSVKAALEADPSLGGLVSSLVVQRSGPPASLSIGTSAVVYVWVPFTVAVHA